MKAALVALVAVGLLGQQAAASDVPREGAVTVREVSAGVYSVSATFEVSESPQIAWEVLTDYASLPRFLPDIRVSVVRERSGGRVLLEQEAVSKFLMFSKRIQLLLDVQEESGVIVFRDTGARSFTRYQGSWRFVPVEGRTQLQYELTAQPAFSVPQFLIGRVLGRDAKEMIDRLRAEIAQRALRAPSGAHGE